MLRLEQKRHDAIIDKMYEEIGQLWKFMDVPFDRIIQERQDANASHVDVNAIIVNLSDEARNQSMELLDMDVPLDENSRASNSASALPGQARRQCGNC